MSINLADHVDGIGSLKLYGQFVDDFSLASSLIKNTNSTTEKPKLAQIRAYSIGNFCVPLPTPILLLVFGDGANIDETDTCGKAGETIWQIDQKDETVLLDVQKGSVLDLLEEAGTKGISGGVKIRDARVEAGKIKATINIWGKISIFGANVSVNENVNISIPLEGCHTVYDFSFGNLKVCVSGGGSKLVNICAKLCLGKWGISTCWEECMSITLPLTQNAPVSDETCDCKK